MANAAGEIQIVQITDTHLFESPDSLLLGVNTQRALMGVLNKLKTQESRLDAILLTGDLVHDGSSLGYQRLQQLVAPLEVPVYMIPGNHDDPKILHAHTVGIFIRHHRAFSLQNWQFILLNSFAAQEVGGVLAASELAFLDQQLSAHPELHCCIALHHPPVDVGSAWLDRIGLFNREEFHAIVDRHPQVRVVLFGHVHQEHDCERNGVRILGSPASSIQFLPGQKEFALDVLPPAYRLLRCRADGSVHTEVIRDHAYHESADLSATHY